MSLHYIIIFDITLYNNIIVNLNHEPDTFTQVHELYTSFSYSKNATCSTNDDIHEQTF